MSVVCVQVCMDTLHWHNSPLNMSQCGSKGSPINIAQMVACVGQQIVGGKRAPNGFKVATLPYGCPPDLPGLCDQATLWLPPSPSWSLLLMSLACCFSMMLLLQVLLLVWIMFYARGMHLQLPPGQYFAQACTLEQASQL